jgi:Type II CAAX prenyl endopeptidase Rce1-like
MKKFTSRLVDLRNSIFSTDVPEGELETPTFITLLKVVWNVIRTFPKERAGQIIGSAFILLMLWGYHGNLELLKLIVPGWRGPGVDIGSRPVLIPGVPWDNELISFWVGPFLLVVVPVLLIKFVFTQNLSEYGLGLPTAGRRKLAFLTFLGLTLISIPAFLVATHDPGMRATYPFYRPFSSVGLFALYELTYLPFFIAIEFIFRGYILFGLANLRPHELRRRGSAVGVPEAFYFGKYAVLIQMLSYTAWHLGKPLPELWGTLIWGLAAGVLAYTVRSIWPVVASHWLLNVLLDALVIYGH